MMKEIGMRKEELIEAMGIALEMRASGQSKILMTKLLAVDIGSVQGVIVAGPSTSAPYAVVSRVQPQVVSPVQRQEDEEDVSITKVQTVI